ncbi:MAG: hypothetical protein ACYTHM_24855 [Planctomycetota bacterium]|jgi:Spy/CpxP family protein refolding chaperone
MRRILGMAITMAMALAFLLPCPLRAEEEPPPGPPPEEGKEKKERKERRDRRDRKRGSEEFFKKLVEELGLNEEQSGKLKEVLRESQKAMQKAMEETNRERTAKVREILTEEQAAKFEELSKRRSRGRSSSGRRGGEGRRPRGGTEYVLKTIFKELELNPEQREKVTQIVEEVQGEVRELIRQAREGGGDPGAVREKVQALQSQILQKVEPILTPEQVEKLKELRKRLGREIMGGSPRDRGRERDRNRPGGGSRNPEEMLKRRLQAIREDLKVIPEVWAVLGEKIENILKTEMEFRGKMREQTKRMREMMQGEVEVETLEKEMGTLREMRANREKKMKDLREDLRELLDLKEEAKLILHGVLD